MSFETLDVEDTSLDEWLTLLRDSKNKKLFVRNMFPSDSHRKEWLARSHLQTDDDARLLLRNFLVSTGTSPHDHVEVALLINKLKENSSSIELTEHERRLLSYAKTGKKFPVWEGLSWVIDLLPRYPRRSLEVIESFFLIHGLRLSDNYLSGLFDAQMVIRSRYIESAQTRSDASKTLDNLTWREVEWLCGALYKEMGFEVNVTSRGNDDGVDVFASKNNLGEKIKIVIQAKKWSETNPVGKSALRELLGTIDSERASKGVLVTTGRFESGVLKMVEKEPRLEIFDKENLLKMLNEYYGRNWFARVDMILANMKQTD